MADLAEGSEFDGSAQTYANDERAKPESADATLTTNDSTLASGCEELARLIARFEAELRVFDRKEAEGAARRELNLAARRALDVSDECSEVVRRLTRLPASALSGVFAKVEVLCTALGSSGLDQDILPDLGRSVRNDIARISRSERSRSTERPHWLTGRRPKSGDDIGAVSQGG